jgi:hypothetical protein
MGDILFKPGSAAFDLLTQLARETSTVFFAGLPGTGKSLLIHQLAHLSTRPVVLLQWDVARPVFEIGDRYPKVNGVTHGIIRLAVGRWARSAIASLSPDVFLIGETPLVGNRLVELARPGQDDAERRLTSARFIIPVPSVKVRAHLEAERARRFQNPQHPRELEDAPPHVMRENFRQLMEAARRLGLAASDEYDPETYARVYRHVLMRRRAQVLPIDEILPTDGFSGYRFSMPVVDLVPTPGQAERAIAETEKLYADPEELKRALDRWFMG